MSKTSSAVVCETNQIQGQNQENVFFHSLYRVPEEFTSSYVRSARSTAPIQICACFSAQGEDTLAAMTLQSVLSKMQEITAQTQLMSVLDYESFTNQVVTVLNNTVCQESVDEFSHRIRQKQGGTNHSQLRFREYAGIDDGLFHHIQAKPAHVINAVSDSRRQEDLPAQPERPIISFVFHPSSY